MLGGDAMEYLAFIVIILIVATGYILAIKKITAHFPFGTVIFN